MSNLNLNWLKNNIAVNPVIFDIGCADMYDTINIKNSIHNAALYAFECSEIWRERNYVTAANNAIHYQHVALSDNDDSVFFYPSDSLDGQDWPWSGSTCSPGSNLLNERWNWGEKYLVPCITLNKFCIENNVFPNVIHIDVQGAEYKVFKNLDTKIRPQIIWAEISEFHMYETETSYAEFKNLMLSYGYEEKYKDNYDALYVLAGHTITEYTPV